MAQIQLVGAGNFVLPIPLKNCFAVREESAATFPATP